MVERRTYKTSLRAPASLVNGFSRLVVEREVLRYLHAVPGGDFDGFCHRKRGLERARVASRDRYRDVIAAWSGCSPAIIEAALATNARAIVALKVQDPAFASEASFPRNAIAAVSGTATPDPAAISLHDYCRLAGESLEMTCAHIDSIAREVTPLLPASMDELVSVATANAVAKGSAITGGSLRKYPEKAIAHYLGRHGNVELTSFEQVAAMMDVYRDTRAKVDVTRGLLFGDGGSHDFSGVAPALLYTCTIPRHVLAYLAMAWNVEPGWVRNTLVGWRRKVDELLPASCQAEPLGSAFAALAKHVLAIAGGDEARVKVVGMLERHRVLHLLHRGVDLSALVDAALRPALARVQAAVVAASDVLVPSMQAIISHETSMPLQVIVTAAAALSRSVATTMASLPDGSPGARNCHAFLAKIDAVVANLPRIEPFLAHYLPGSRYTGAVGQVLASFHDVQRRHVSRLFTAVRGIITLAFAANEATAIAQFKSVLVPDTCVTRPYTSSKRTKRHLPVNLLFNKYVVIRKEHPAATRLVNGKDREAFLDNNRATGILREGKPIWLGIPIYSPDQFNTATRRLSGSRKGLFWFELVPTGPIVARLRRGARLETIRLDIPRGPARKIVADMVLVSDDRMPFARGTRFIEAMHATHGATSFPRDEYLGCDLNTLGPHAIALGTSTTTIDLHSGSNLLAPVEMAARRIHALRVEIARVQHAIDTARENNGDVGHQRGQLALLHQRIARVRGDAERHVLMIYLYVLHRTGARHASWDAVAVSTRGTRGTLATAIASMPKRAGLFADFKAWARDLASAGVLPRFEDVTPVTPYTGRACDDCFAATGELRHTRKASIPYHEFECTSCGKHGNRHEVSARLSALLLKQLIEQATVAAPGASIESRSSAGFL
jgi:hypothetical protein